MAMLNNQMVIIIVPLLLIGVYLGYSGNILAYIMLKPIYRAEFSISFLMNKWTNGLLNGAAWSRFAHRSRFSASRHRGEVKLEAQECSLGGEEISAGCFFWPPFSDFGGLRLAFTNLATNYIGVVICLYMHDVSIINHISRQVTSTIYSPSAPRVNLACHVRVPEGDPPTKWYHMYLDCIHMYTNCGNAIQRLTRKNVNQICFFPIGCWRHNRIQQINMVLGTKQFLAKKKTNHGNVSPPVMFVGW